jgi:hypothetical protein
MLGRPSQPILENIALAASFQCNADTPPRGIQPSGVGTKR